MAEKLNTDIFKRVVVTERDICNHLYLNPNFEYSHIQLEDPSKYNEAIESLYSDLPKLEALEKIELDPLSWHDQNQNIWFMPDAYKQFDIAKWVLDQCQTDFELQRAGTELMMYAERDLLDLLKYLKYFVDTMRQHNIVWGVGRGSSVASYVLYLIGVHKVNSIYYDLDIKEFIR